jgi:hypothetical protein
MNLKYHVETYLTGLDPKSLIIDDFNGDSILDLAVTNYGNDTFSILFGNGNGTFSTQKIFSTGNMTKPYGIAAGDFNNDKLLDLGKYLSNMIESKLIFLSISAISLSEMNKVAIFYGNATNDLFIRSPNMLTLSSNGRLGAIESGDLTDDGLIDLIVCNQPMSGTLHDAAPFIFLNTGDDRQFEMNSLLEHYGCHIPIVIGDFDHDGKQNDLSTFGIRNSLLFFQSVNYKTRYLMMHLYALHGDPLSQTKGRFNNDELDDLALIIPQANTLQILLAYGNKAFTRGIYSTANHSTSITRIYFNNDQIDDLAILSCNRTVTIFLGTPSGFFNKNYLSFEPNERNNTQCAHSLKVADLNQDGIDDLVFIDAEIHSIAVLLGTNGYEET